MNKYLGTGNDFKCGMAESSSLVRNSVMTVILYLKGSDRKRN